MSGNDDIIVGTGTEGRGAEELRPIVGMFVNTLALRQFPRPERTFDDFMEELKSSTLRDFDHQGYPFEDIIETLGVKRDTARNPLFDVSFQLNNFDTPAIKHTVPNIEPFPVDFKVSKFDLTLWAYDRGDSLSFSLEYSTRLFRHWTAGIFTTYFRQIVNEVIRDSRRTLYEIQRISGEARQKLLREMNYRVKDGEDLFSERGKVIQRYLNDAFEKFTTNVAIECGQKVLTYKELERRSNQIAGYLKSRAIEKGTLVGLLMDDRVSLIQWMVGALKAGCVFVMLDPALPPGTAGADGFGGGTGVYIYRLAGPFVRQRQWTS